MLMLGKALLHQSVLGQGFGGLMTWLCYIKVVCEATSTAPAELESGSKPTPDTAMKAQTLRVGKQGVFR